MPGAPPTYGEVTGGVDDELSSVTTEPSVVQQISDRMSAMASDITKQFSTKADDNDLKPVNPDDLFHFIDGAGEPAAERPLSASAAVRPGLHAQPRATPPPAACAGDQQAPVPASLLKQWLAQGYVSEATFVCVAARTSPTVSSAAHASSVPPAPWLHTRQVGGRRVHGDLGNASGD